MKAALGGKLETMKYLNSEYPNLKNGRDKYDNTVLTLAAGYAQKSFRFLVEEIGMDATEIGPNGRNCFLEAAINGKMKTLRFLNSGYPNLKKGRDNSGKIAL